MKTKGAIMKQILSVLSVLALSMILVACGNKEGNGNKDGFDTYNMPS